MLQQGNWVDCLGFFKKTAERAEINRPRGDLSDQSELLKGLYSRPDCGRLSGRGLVSLLSAGGVGEDYSGAFDWGEGCGRVCDCHSGQRPLTRRAKSARRPLPQRERWIMARVFQSSPLKTGMLLQLTDSAAHHLATVLRAKIGDSVTIFNGEGGEYQSVIKEITKKKVIVETQQFLTIDRESPLDIYLAQGISRGEKMDYTIQKAVELGVKKIFPIITERCNVKLDEERRDKRLLHWTSVIISACEQSGRNHVPEILLPQKFENFLKTADADWKFILAPQASKKLSEFPIKKNSRVILLIGPEGGFSDNEIKIATDFHALNLGPRILRTETAGLTALSALQFYAGDL